MFPCKYPEQIPPNERHEAMIAERYRLSKVSLEISIRRLAN
jgi:hypothetical protein